MGIETTYRTLIIDEYIKDQLSRGVSINAEDVELELTELIESLDLSVPQFTAADYHVDSEEESSAAKHIDTFSTIQQDLRALFKEALKLTTVSRDSFERWKLEAVAIEKQLIDLEDRIENLLLLTQDTEGYHSVIVENFTDTVNVDLENTTAEVDLNTASVQLDPVSGTLGRIFLNDLDLTRDVKFKVRSTVDFINREDLVGSSLTNVFKQDSTLWMTSIGMRKAKPVTCELTVKLGDEAVDISKIVLELHDSTESSPVTITPLYSADNETYLQIPSNTFTMETRETIVFSFTPVEAKWIKFILIKEGPDTSDRSNIFTYQFGFKEIAFYHQGFETTELGDNYLQLISHPRYQLGFDGLAAQFEKLTLEVCERIEENTDIRYFVTASNDPLVPLSGSTLWIPVSPLGRADPEHPQLIVVGEANEAILGLDEDIQVSYDKDGVAGFINPASGVQLLSRHSTTNEILDEEIISTATRYRFANSGDKILNYQVKLQDTGSGSGEGVDMNLSTLVLFRNTGEKGLDPTDPTSIVREVQRGWKFEEPWYSCVIEILNPDGMTINVGDQAIQIDDVSYQHKIDGTILTGKTQTTSGIHRIRVHKSNWRHVAAGADSLSALQAADVLYPYNHKLLIEGYDYGSSFPTASKIYLGADIFAEILMKRVSIFDMIRNVAKDNYRLFALDQDAPDSHTGGNSPTRVFVIKADEESADFQNERFVIKFTQINQLQRYLRLRADFITEDESITPALHSYKIKLG